MNLAGKTFGFHIHYPNLTYNFLYSYKKVDVYAAGVANNVAVATVDNNVATSMNEGLNGAPTVAWQVEDLGSLSNTFSEDNKDDVKAEGVGLPPVFLTGNKEVKNCVNS